MKINKEKEFETLIKYLGRVLDYNIKFTHFNNKTGKPVMFHVDFMGRKCIVLSDPKNCFMIKIKSSPFCEDTNTIWVESANRAHAFIHSHLEAEWGFND